MREFHISATEISDFLRCRRAWWFQSPNGRSLQKRGMPAIHFHQGSAMHYALEAQANGDEPISALTQWFETKHAEIEQDHRNKTGMGLTSQERYELDKSRELCLDLAKRYFDKYGWENPIAPLTYIAREVSFKLPIVTHSPVYLVGTIDGLALDGTGGLHIVETKTYGDGGAPDPTKLETDHQLNSYAWAVTQLLGEMPVGALYDGIAKKLPARPARTKDGRLSRQMISSTFEIYQQAILDNDESPDDPFYHDVLEKLYWQNQGKVTPFHSRHTVSFRPKAIQTFGTDLVEVANDMWVAQQQESKRYPNFRWEGCWDCDVKDLCQATQFGEDVDTAIEQSYRVGTYGTRKAQKDLQPEYVSNLADLQRVIAAKRGQS